MIKSEGGTKLAKKKYKGKYDIDISENIQADIFDKNKKDLYFGITYILDINPRGVVAYWKLWESKIIANVLAKGINERHETKKRLFKKGLKQARDDVKEYYEHHYIKDSGRTFEVVLMLGTDRKELFSYHEVGVSPLKITIQIPDYEALKLLEDRTRIIKHAEIDHLSDEEIIEFESRIVIEQVEFLLTLTEVKNLVKILEIIEKNKIPESDEPIIEIKENEWKILYHKACLCIECKKHNVEEEFLLGTDNDSIDVSFDRKEINELLWALKRLLQKYETEIKHFVKVGV